MAEGKPAVLIVDDQPNWRSLFSDLLEDDYEVVGVGSYEEALKELEDRVPPFRVAVVDIRLDDKDTANEDGLRLIEKIGRHAIVVVVTSYPTIETIRKALQDLGVYDYIEKVPGNGMDFENVFRYTMKKIKSENMFWESYRILVMASDLPWCRKLVDVLKDNGYKVDIVPLNEKASEQIGKGCYRLVVIETPNIGRFEDLSEDMLNIMQSMHFRPEIVIITEEDSARAVLTVNGSYGIENMFHKDRFSVNAFLETVAGIYAPLSRCHIEAWFEGLGADEALEVGTEYTFTISIQPGTDTSRRRASIALFLLPADQSRELELVLLAEDMDVLPSQYQVLEIPPRRFEGSAHFRVIPRWPGRKGIDLEIRSKDQIVSLSLTQVVMGVLESRVTQVIE